MAQRLDLQALLTDLLGSDKVYFQPPSNVVLQYPCFIYERDDQDTRYASNRGYQRHWEYQVTYISRDPDDPMLDTLSDLPLCSFDRSFTMDQLHHNIFNIYF